MVREGTIVQNCRGCVCVKRITAYAKPYDCRFFDTRQDTNSGWKLAELALVNPTGLNEALSKLPFKVSLDFTLPKR